MTLTFIVSMSLVITFEPSFNTQRTITFFTFLFSIGMGRYGYSLFQRIKFKNLDISRLSMKISLKKILYKEKK